jgi:orotate phosphoribosyltransferase
MQSLDNLEDAIHEYCLEKGIFPISNGNFVSTWIDLYPLTCDRKMMSSLTNALSSRLFLHTWDFSYIAGKELHGTLLASSLVNKCNWLESDLVIVRKEADTIKVPHSFGRELPHIKESNCILIDEVISSGTNMESSITDLSYRGFNVSGVLSVVYRGGGAKEKAEGMGIPFDYLYEIPEELI